MAARHDQLEEAIADLVAKICPILSGHAPEVQSAALADLTAMWLAGMQDIENPDNPALLALREQLFASWCNTVRLLVPVNSAALRARHGLPGDHE
jgi:hypothetical protein